MTKKRAVLFIVIALIVGLAVGAGIMAGLNAGKTTGTIIDVDDEAEPGGQCGENLTWSVSSYDLTISGSGAMYDYSAENPAPWKDEKYYFVEIDSGVTSIGAYAFYQSRANDFILPDGLTSIGDHAFAECTSIYGLSLPQSATEISESAFTGSRFQAGRCGDGLIWTLSSYTLEISGSGAMYDYSAENPAPWKNMDYSFIRIDSGVTSVGAYAFYQSSANSLTLAEGLTEIGSHAFDGCSSLYYVTIPQSTAKIGSRAFACCSGLYEINIPANMTELAADALYGCSEMRTIIFCGTQDQFKTIGLQVPYNRMESAYAQVRYHNYSYRITTAATCDDNGVGTYTCTYCGDSYTETIQATGHTYKATVTAPTCTEQGYTTYQCTGCSSSYVDNYTDALGHSYAEGTIAATCVPGYEVKICSRCGDMQTEMIPAVDEHTYVDGVCTVCGAKQ